MRKQWDRKSGSRIGETKFTSIDRCVPLKHIFPAGLKSFVFVADKNLQVILERHRAWY